MYYRNLIKDYGLIYFVYKYTSIDILNYDSIILDILIAHNLLQKYLLKDLLKLFRVSKAQ